MKKLLLILLFLPLLFSCTENNRDNNISSNTNEEFQLDNLLGTYNAIFSAYYMKNKFGDDMIINGEKVYIPKTDLKFILEEKGGVSLQQTNLEDGDRYYYNGTFEIIDGNENKWQKIKCSLTDGEYSNPIYYLLIYPLQSNGFCSMDSIFPSASGSVLKKIN